MFEARIYLDCNATTGLHPDLKPHLAQWIEMWGNPSSVHESGRHPKSILRDSRASLAKLIECDPLEIIFTASGSEGNNLALKGLFFELQKKQANKNHLLISSVEHPSLQKAAEFLRTQGVEVEKIAVDRDGKVNLEILKKQIRSTTFLVSVMMANNETGALFPLSEICKIAHDKGVLVHTDAVQALGKIPINLKETPVDLATFAAHKFYGLKGAGALFVRRGVALEPLIHGGGQERSRRGGTENILAIAAFGEMAKRKNEVKSQADRLASLRDFMESELQKNISDLKINTSGGQRLPNTSSCLLPGIDGEILLMNLDMQGVSVSTGSACSSGSQEPSLVLQAMGFSAEEANSTLRVSMGWMTTKEEVEQFVQILTSTVEEIRSRKLKAKSVMTHLALKKAKGLGLEVSP